MKVSVVFLPSITLMHQVFVDLKALRGRANKVYKNVPKATLRINFNFDVVFFRSSISCF